MGDLKSNFFVNGLVLFFCSGAIYLLGIGIYSLFNWIFS